MVCAICYGYSIASLVILLIATEKWVQKKIVVKFRTASVLRALVRRTRNTQPLHSSAFSWALRSLAELHHPQAFGAAKHASRCAYQAKFFWSAQATWQLSTKVAKLSQLSHPAKQLILGGSEGSAALSQCHCRQREFLSRACTARLSWRQPAHPLTSLGIARQPAPRWAFSREAATPAFASALC